MVIAGLIIVVALIVLGAPVWMSIFAGASLMVVSWGMDVEMIASLMVSKLSNILLIAVPLFIFSGNLLAMGGAATPLVKVLNRFLGHIPGGPAYVVIVACMVFAAMSSSGIACVAAFAPIMLPMMAAMGYSKKFSIGLLLSSASLGPFIPPSIPLILFGYMTETSIRDLYTASFMPGLLLGALLAVTVFIHSRRGHYVPPPSASWGERWQALKEAWPVLLMPLVILVPIYQGWDTPSEASAVAVFYSLFLGFVVYRQLTLQKLWQAASQTVHTTAAIFLIVMSAFMLNTAFTYRRIPFIIVDAISGAGFTWASFAIVAILIFLGMGMFLDQSAILMIVGPLLMPVVEDLGMANYDLVYGVLVSFSIEMAGLTPPYGIVLFASVGIIKEDFSLITKGVFLFYPALIVGALMIAYIPAIALSLPRLMGLI